VTSIRVAVVLFLSGGCAAAPTPDPEAESRIVQLEKQTAELGRRVDALTAALIELTGDKFGPSTVCPPSIDAEVLAVKRDLKLVVLDKGRKYEVKVGYVFDVYLGSTYKGRVRVQDVQEDTSTGVILSEMNPIAPGDSATTSL
jgi:hypothetical protein